MEPEYLDTVTTSEAARILSISDRTLRRRLAAAQIKPAIPARAPGEENRYDRAAILALAYRPAGELQLQQPAPPVAAIRAALAEALAPLSAQAAASQATMADIAARLERIEARLDQLPPPPSEQEIAAEIASPRRSWWQFWR
jgi:hypothetical protein